MRTHGVEVAQQDDVPLRVGLLDVHQHLLKHAFRPTIGVGALALGAVLRDGYLHGVTIDGGATAEDDVLAAMTAHHVDQHKGTGNVVLVVFPRLLYALAHGLQAGKVDAGIELMRRKYTFEPFAVADIHLTERNFGNADNFRHPPQRLRIAVAQVVDHHCGMACLIKLN